MGVVTQRSGGSATIGFTDGSTHPLTGLPDALKAGDVIAAAPAGGDTYAVRTIPEVSGGMVVEAPDTGRVMAMYGLFALLDGLFYLSLRKKFLRGVSV